MADAVEPLAMLGREAGSIELDLDLRLADGDVELVPMTGEHGRMLQPWIAADRDAFALMLSSPLAFDDDGVRFYQWLVDGRGADSLLPFVALDARDGSFLGHTRYLHIDRTSRTLHVGGTYYVPRGRGTVLNPTCKRLLLGHAFECAGFNRVSIQTDERNVRSRRAIEKLGAVFEGIIRAQYIARDGAIRNTALYSILRTEWHEVEPRLRALEAAAPPIPVDRGSAR